MAGQNARDTSRGKPGDNRRFRRRHIELPVLYTFIENIKTCGGETGNISEGGLLVYLKEALLEGMKLRIEIFPPNFFGLKPIRAVTKIVWAPAEPTGGWGEYIRHGLKFIEMDNQSLQQLRRLLEYMEE